MFGNYRPGRCYIIAEIGGNFTTHEEATRLIDAAAACGVDAVKLQTYRAETLATRTAVFDMENTGVVSQFDLFKRYEIDESLHDAVFRYAERRHLDWFSTPSHESDVDLLERFRVGAHKIGSDDAVNAPLLRRVARTRKPVILSTGMCTLDEVRESVAVLEEEGAGKIILLHAVTAYPTHAADVNLRAIQTLKDTFPHLDVGYSDHTLTPVASICAVAMGAQVLERHFTCDKNADGPDHRLSADPQEMSWLVQAVRAFEVMRGDGIKVPAAAESVTRINNRKSVVLTRPVSAGELLTEAHLTVKRPGTGIEPKQLGSVVGRRARVDLEADAVLAWDHLL